MKILIFMVIFLVETRGLFRNGVGDGQLDGHCLVLTCTVKPVLTATSE